MELVLRNARTWQNPGPAVCDLKVVGGRIAEVAAAGRLPAGEKDVDLEGRLVLPGIVNGHDHLDFSTFPPLGSPPYASVYEWAAAVNGGRADPAAQAALCVPLADRLFLGGLRNLLAAATAVAHHNPYHRSLGQPGFPVRVLARYSFAHSPGLTPRLRGTYRTTDRRVPWMVHLAEGTDERCRRELQVLIEENLLRPNTVIIHGIGLRAEDARKVAAVRASVVWCPESNRRLYGATAPAAALQAAGARVGLGSDSPVSGVRDALSNLAAARRERALSDRELLQMATRGTADVTRLPVGGFTKGSPADLVALDSLDDFLEGKRPSLALAVVAGRALYGEPRLMAAASREPKPLHVDGAERRLDASLALRAARILRAHPAVQVVPWLSGVRFAGA